MGDGNTAQCGKRANVNTEVPAKNLPPLEVALEGLIKRHGNLSGQKVSTEMEQINILHENTFNSMLKMEISINCKFSSKIYIILIYSRKSKNLNRQITIV